MKKQIAVFFVLVFFAASPAFSETLNLKTLPVTTGGGYYVGAVGGNIDGGAKANYYCDDFLTTSYVPSSFTVLVSSLSDISKTKFVGADPAETLKKYQQVGWLMSQLELNPVKIAAIQFAMWSVFTPSAPTFADSAAWLDASARIDAASYDFSMMRIYTPISGSNQEFIGGKVTVVPEPAEWLLLFMGLGFISYAVYRKRGQILPQTSV